MKSLRPLFAGGLLLSLNSLALASDAEEQAQVREDCAAEGLDAGLQGSALDRFVDRCVSELISAELVNQVE